MDEKTLLKISIIVGFAGVTLLLLMSRTIELKDTDISLTNDLENKLLISGKVLNVIEYNNSATIRIAKTEFIDIVVFDKKNLDFLALRDGDEIEAIGKAEKDNGKMQLIADEIRVI